MKGKSMAFNLNIPKDWEKEWQDMPEFNRIDGQVVQKIIINFRSHEDVKKFGELIGRKLTTKTDSIWFPNYKTPTGVFVDKEDIKE